MTDIKSVLTKLKGELPSNVKLVAVSKFHPIEAVIEAYNCGQRAFGESRPQELKAKAEQMISLGYDDLEWHFIGHLQTNKLKMVLPYASLVESVDSVRLLESIDNWCRLNDMITDVLLEYHISSDETKQGFDKEEILSVMLGEKSYPNVRIRGLMGMATLTDNENVIREDFSRIVSLAGELNEKKEQMHGKGDLFGLLSFGMSGDYKIAVDMGAGIVRIGTMIFGERQY